MDILSVYLLNNVLWTLINMIFIVNTSKTFFLKLSWFFGTGPDFKGIYSKHFFNDALHFQTHFSVMWVISH